MPRVIHFEIGVDNPGRSARFYTKVFGWKIEKWAGPTDYWLVTTGENSEPGINGAIMPRSDSSTTVNTIGVSSYDEFARKITAAGGKAVSPKMTIPGIGQYGYFLDTEGNRFGIMQNDPSAK
ncbi:MAG: glyoxalase [Chloroflexi bacterium RBG_16_56_11]|nr:MAG: glyoxalase [Chloroflexi bacterium RBG_16_56_11]